MELDAGTGYFPPSFYKVIRIAPQTQSAKLAAWADGWVFFVAQGPCEAVRIQPAAVGKNQMET
ncbi:MAG: hypothetical protein JNL67_07935 [Planctomycetaceae bacterium]|nr:hypothetical protein [Planctomycetaceae bacterium]